MHDRSSLARLISECSSRQLSDRLRCPDPWTLHWPADDLAPANLTDFQKHWLFDAWRSRVVVASKTRDFEQQVHQIVTSPDDLAAYQYVSLNTYCRSYVWCIALDIDDSQRWGDLQALSIPPNLVGRNVGPDPSRQGNTQAIWLLESPVRREMTRAWDYLYRIRYMLSDPDLVGGDGAFTHGMSRNPFYTGGNATYAWTMLHEHRWRLDELAEGLEREGFPVPRPGQPLPARHRVTATSSASDRSDGPRGNRSDAERPGSWIRNKDGQIERNESMFTAARFYAYPLARAGKKVTEADILNVIEPMNADLEGLDPIRKGLPKPELRGIARSVAKYFSQATFGTDAVMHRGHFRFYTYKQRVTGGRNRAKQVTFATAQAKGNASQKAAADRSAAEMQRLKRLGRSAREIATMLSAGYSTVTRHLNRVLPESLKLYVEQGTSESSTTQEKQGSACPTDTATGERPVRRKLRIVTQSSPIDVPVYAIESAEESTSATRVRERDQGRSRSAPGRLKSVS